jgi:hypothetical protein
MGKGGGSAPSPDPRIGEAAVKQADTGEKWLTFARDQFKASSERQVDLDKLNQKVVDQQLGIGDFTLDKAKADRAEYEAKAIPARAAFADEASNYGSPANQERAAAEAGANVSWAGAAQRDSTKRQMAAVGIAPGSGEYAGITRAGGQQEALARAGGQTQARQGVRDKGLALKADVANLYSGLPAQSAQSIGASLAASSGAAGLGLANQQQFNNNAAGMAGGFGGAQAGYQGMATTLTNQYGLQLDAWKAKQEANAANIGGIASAVGTVAGLAFMSDPKSKKNVKASKDGDGLKAVKKLKINKFDYKPGQGDGGKGHTGPMSDNFAKATGQRDSGQIKFQDAIGITMKAVQDLDKRVSQLDKSLSKGKPKARRSSQSPAKARSSSKPAKTAMTTARPQVKAQAYGIRRG